MKYLHIVPSVNPESGGPIEGIKQIQAALRSFDVTMDVVCCDLPDAPWLKTTTLIKVSALGLFANGYGYTPKLRPWLKENVNSYDAVIVHGLWQYPGFAVRSVLSNLRQPYFVFTHGMLDPWFKRNYPLKHIKKWLYWPWAQYRVLRDAAAVIFTSNEERVLARQSFWLYKANERVVQYGTTGPTGDPVQYKKCFRTAFPDLRDKSFILYLGRIHPKKGCDILVKSFNILCKSNSSLQLVFAGPDQVEWIPELQRMSADLGISDRIHWLGMVQGDVKWGAFYSADAFILPSHQENFGIAVAEALACGVPVLISDKINIWREIADDKAGMVASDTVEGTTSLLTSWIRLSKEDKEEMAKNAKGCFNNRFESRRAAESLIKIVDECTLARRNVSAKQ